MMRMLIMRIRRIWLGMASKMVTGSTRLKMSSLLKRLVLTLDMIKFEHSVFALPFALTGALLAFREDGFATPNPWWKLAWIIAAMVGARSAAMTFNRILDADIDRKNPRTATRHLPAGLLSARFAWAFLLTTSALF